MRIMKGQLIAGLPALKVRDFFRYERGIINEVSIGHWLTISKTKRLALLEKLSSEGYLRRKKNGIYEFTDLGRRLGCASGAPPLSRPKAEAMLEDLKKRIEHVNSDAAFTWYVRRIVVFGSFLDPSRQQLGDLDVAVEILRKPGLTGEDDKALTLRDERNGKKFKGEERYYWPGRKVEAFLKNGQQGLSLHGVVQEGEILEKQPTREFTFQIHEQLLTISSPEA